MTQVAQRRHRLRWKLIVPAALVGVAYVGGVFAIGQAINKNTPRPEQMLAAYDSARADFVKVKSVPGCDIYQNRTHEIMTVATNGGSCKLSR